tara:strand:- start:395 stop:565 length:171 start_codon:yes stop_codon:yes gene_type:complete
MGNPEYHFYLDLLQDSGEINMFGAPSVLQDVFNISKKEAIEVTTEWMESKRKKDNR